MIKKYKKIGALLLGLSCLTMGFFTPVDTYGGFFIRKGDKNNAYNDALERCCKKLVVDMTTKELFNVVYGVLREKSTEMIFSYYAENTPKETLYTITFAMPPQSADDYGLITIRYNQHIGYNQYDSDTLTGEIRLYHYVNFYIDKGSSKDMSVLKMEDHYDVIRMWANGKRAVRLYEYAVGEGTLIDVHEEKTINGYKYVEEINGIIYNAIAAKVKGERASAPNRSKER